jgi:hypothetical protein
MGSAEVSFACTRSNGAVLSFPMIARCEDTVSRDHFRKWIIRHINSWFAFTQVHGLGIEMADIILVTGCHHTRSWTNVTFNEVQAGAQLSPLNVDSQNFGDVNLKSMVHNQGPSGKVSGMQISRAKQILKIFDVPSQNLPENQCIFIRGYRVKHYLSGIVQPKAAVEPKPDLQRSDCELEKEVVSISSATEV